MSFTDVFILGIEYIRPYTVCCFFLSFVMFSTKLKVKTHLIILLCFLLLFTLYNILTPFVIAPDKHYRYVAAIIGIALLHFIIISQSLQKVEIAKVQKYLLYSICFVCILALTESFINIFFQEFSYPFRANKSNAVIFFKRSYVLSTEPSTLGAFIVSTIPLIDTRKYSNGKLILFYALVSSAVLSTLSVFVIIVYSLYLSFRVNYRYFIVLFIMIFIVWSIIPNEIIEAFNNKLLFQGSGSSAERLDHITGSINASFNNMILGMGWGAETKLMDSSSHNFFLGILLSNGFIGVLFFALFLSITFFRYPPYKSYINKISWYSIIISGIFLLNSSSFYEPNYLFGLAFLVAYGHVRGINI